tara:strand:- start:198 stop:401 length:204 start_codon:yes stop_codon:yes gene_type:complete
MNRQNVNKIAMQKMHSRYAKIIVALVRGSDMLVSEGEKPHIASTPKGQIFQIAVAKGGRMRYRNCVA